MGIDVSGGAGGVAARLDELDHAGGALVRLGAGVGEVAVAVLEVAVDPSVAAAPFVVARHDPLGTPATAWRVAQLELDAVRIGGPGGLGGEAVRLAGLATTLLAVAAAYRAADLAAASAMKALQDLAMEATAGVALLILPLLVIDGVAEGPDALLRRLDDLAYDHPWLVDAAAGGIDALVTRIGAADPAVAIVLGAAAARAGVPWPPRSEEDAVRILAAFASLTGALDEDDGWRAVEVSPVVTSPGQSVGGPSGVAGLVAGAIDLGDGTDPGRVRVIEVIQPDGTSVWILQIPGTQEWGSRPGANPFDLTTNVEAMTGEATLAATAATTALDRAMAAAGRAGSGDRVMIVGHSQGGIIAASLASDARFRAAHHVTDVVTFGSPIGRFPIPRTVTVLSVEHAQDPVPRLDAVPNPDRPTWTTVTRDLTAPSTGRSSTGGAASSSALAAHSADRYAETAREIDDAVAAGRSRSLSAWAREAAPFVGGSGRAVVTDYHVRRSAAARPGGGSPAGRGAAR